MSSDATADPPPPAGSRPPRRKRSFLKLLLLLLLLGLLAAGGAGYWGWEKFKAPGPLASETNVVIPKGAGLSRITKALVEAGVIEPDWLFKIIVTLLKQDQALKAGEYSFPAGVSMQGAMQILVAGVTVSHKVTVPEGLTSWEIIQLLNAVPDLVGEAIAEIPGEGTLLPETYFFELGDTRAVVLERMQAAHVAALAKLWDGRDEGLPIADQTEWVTLASIVEKETGLASERPLVASVYINRLRKGMLLQSDPTVVYGITGGKGPLGHGLTRKELDKPTPYNTYTTAGLPPGPIANPGWASLEAVLHPAESKYLYFVADGTGGHAFAETLAEHNKNVQKWREIEKQKKQGN